MQGIMLRVTWAKVPDVFPKGGSGAGEPDVKGVSGLELVL